MNSEEFEVAHSVVLNLARIAEALERLVELAEQTERVWDEEERVPDWYQENGDE